MIRVTKLGRKLYAFEFEDLWSEQDNIEEFLNAGDAVLLCNEVDDAANLLGVAASDIEIVEDETEL